MSGVLPLAAGTEGEALWFRPTGSGTRSIFLSLDPLQTSAKAGLATAPLQSAFMCPLMKKPPAQQLAIKLRQIETPKYESATLPNSPHQTSGLLSFRETAGRQKSIVC